MNDHICLLKSPAWILTTYFKQTRVDSRDELGAITAVWMRDKGSSEQETTYEEIDSKVL